MEKEKNEIIWKAKEYAVAQFQARSDVKHTKQAMLSICWYNGYDLAAAFAAGVNFHAKVWQEEVHKICNGNNGDQEKSAAQEGRAD